MHTRIPLVLASALATAALMASAPASADAVLANGSFETGDFSGWTTQNLNPFNNGVVSDGTAAAGLYYAYFGNDPTADGPGGISQTLNTVIGKVYDVSFSLRNDADVAGNSTPNYFEFDWDGAAVMTLTDASPFGWTYHEFFLTASSTSTVMNFVFDDGPFFWSLDGVAIPEPGALTLVALAGMLALAASRRRRA